MACPQPKTYDQLTDRELDAQLDQNTISAIWHYTKDNYFGRGIPHHEAISDMAREFDLPERVIAYALDKPKSLRRVSEEAKQRMRETGRFLNSNKKYLASFDRTAAEKLVLGTAEGVRGTLLTWHGPVVTPIHGINTLYTDPVKFLRAEIRGVMSLTEEGVDKYMASMTDTPEKAAIHKILLDAGAPIGKEETGDWLTAHGLLKHLGEKYDIKFLKQRSWASKAMDGALKPLRFEIMMDQFKKLDSSLQNDASAKLIAELYSHATGAMVRREPAMRQTGFLRKLALAPQLTIANWMTIFDAAKTARTWERLGESRVPGLKTRPPSPEEIAVAWGHTKKMGKYAGILLGSLLVNDAFLKGSGSKQRINISDASKTDWLSYKGFGHYWRPRGALEIIRLIGHIMTNMHIYGKQPYGKSPEETFGRYAEYKLHPAFGVAKELVSGRDIFGRPVPWSPERGTTKFPRLTYPEYIAQRGPIFFGHAVQAAYDGARSQGIPEPTIKQVFGQMAKHPEIFTESALTGAAEFMGINIQPDLSLKQSGGGTRPAPPKQLRPTHPRR